MIVVNQLQITLSTMFVEKNSLTKKTASIAREEIHIIKDFNDFSSDFKIHNPKAETTVVNTI
ncbi:MAG: hypothetical protein SWQ30_04125 [Thermodesulfobacteriota bacterium]|nr:hypothetical protein [Thermodesulfobacteriota bacterium]